MALLTLRADFYDRPMQYPELFHLVEAQHLSLLVIEPDDLRRVVEQPAALPDVQVTFEGDLVNRFLFEVQGQVGALPLLQFTLDQLFKKRSGRQLTLSAYRELGGVKGALTKQAEETYTSLPSDEHRRLSRALFVRLIDPGATEQDTTRRRAALSELTLADATQTRLLQEVADAFIAARLLTTNEVGGTTTIEGSHEALIREWPRLAGWLREARDDIPWQQAISKDVADWERRGKPGDRLYRGSQLKEAQAWARRNTPSGNEVAFLRAGAARRMRSVASVTVIVLLLLSTTGLASWFWFLFHPDPTRVTNIQDDGMGSLRWAITNASLGSTITFNEGLRGTILLTSSDLNIAKNLTIRGPGVGMLSISSGKSGRTVRVVQGISATISGLAFKDSDISNGFIYNEGTLMLSNSTVSGNSETNSGVSGGVSGGGGIFNGGTLMLFNSTVSGNMATGSVGGGIFNYDGVLTLTNSTISDNKASSDGGGIAFSEDSNFNSTPPPSAMLLYCTVYGNTADVGGGMWAGNIKKGHMTTRASIVAGNSAHIDPDIVGPVTSLGYNLVGDRSGATFLGSPKKPPMDVLGIPLSKLRIDPMLRDNGGSTKPHTLTLALLPAVAL